MPYYKTAIGKTPFFTNNRGIRIDHYNCQLLKKCLLSADIIAVVNKIPNGCLIITNSSYSEVVDKFRVLLDDMS